MKRQCKAKVVTIVEPLNFLILISKIFNLSGIGAYHPEPVAGPDIRNY